MAPGDRGARLSRRWLGAPDASDPQLEFTHGTLEKRICLLAERAGLLALIVGGCFTFALKGAQGRFGYFPFLRLRLLKVT
jgi:hypothetical protein